MFDGEKQLRDVGWNRRETATQPINSSTITHTSNDSEVALSPSYLHRHSRQTRLKLILPFASGTSPSAIFNAEDETEEEMGAKADTEEQDDEAVAATRIDDKKNFMVAVEGGVCICKGSSIYVVT